MHVQRSGLHCFVNGREDKSLEKGEKERTRQKPVLQQENWVLAEERPIEKPSVEVRECANQNGLQ